MQLEIITHCWKFSRVLAYQLSSLALNPPQRLAVVVNVMYSEDDEPTVKMLQFFHGKVPLKESPLPHSQLFRRAYGRNIAAKATQADLVWFCDADYVFGTACLDSLAGKTFADDQIYYPREILENLTLELGDEYALRVTGPNIYPVDPADFQPRKMRKAIGGLQIVTGDTARKDGYCDGCKVSHETDRCSWHNLTMGDQVYRGMMGVNRGTPISLPNLRRIRQSQRGVVDSLVAEK